MTVPDTETNDTCWTQPLIMQYPNPSVSRGLHWFRWALPQVQVRANQPRHVEPPTSNTKLLNSLPAPLMDQQPAAIILNGTPDAPMPPNPYLTLAPGDLQRAASCFTLAATQV
ncbi:predicted protein [Plenodomus lingam JN3]|uniref:Predicted protein n=1 Tax=Leptosphaeria maculans (strain JN3 / isolate v23.1.3 / race Av1-4-5-6-7-8) TaxID=985895 RepID=E5A236_LEPMJ|nr:predicted protein [Plenodomus lingam JN3]CBX97753.1 predicted protein [Plenodomus lingam JN3]